MNKKWLLYASAVFLVGCTPRLARKQLNGWIGESREKLVQSWGNPNKRKEMAGELFYGYIRCSEKTELKTKNRKDYCERWTFVMNNDIIVRNDYQKVDISDNDKMAELVIER